MLKQRVITAVIMIAIIGAGIVFLPVKGLAILLGSVVLLAAWEWSELAGLKTLAYKLTFVLMCAALMFALSAYTQLLGNLQVDSLQDILGVACTWWAIALLWVKSYPASAVLWRSSAVRIAMGFLVLVPAWAALVYLRLHLHGVVVIFILIALVAAADIGAYFSGRAWGKAKLAPNVSPGKSWAGFWGGLACSALFAYACWLLLDDGRMQLRVVMAIAVITALASVLGDLVESMIKREQGVKDSGVMLPGHGGMMDRLDSLCAAAPVFALSLMLAGW